MNNGKKRLIHILPGPIYHFGSKKYKILSGKYVGDIITSSNRKNILEINNVEGFVFHCLKCERGLHYDVYFLIYCLYISIKTRLKGDKYDFVLTYDPLKTGLLGVMVSKVLGCKLIVEVNGVYTSPAEYLDGEEHLYTKFKKYFFPIIEGYVLKRASGIKLLFNGQIDYFKSKINGKVISSFINYVDLDIFLELPMNFNNKIVLFVGFPFKRKGVDILINAFKQISNNYPEWRLRILGWFPDKKELMMCIDGHQQIEYCPPVEYKDMPMQLAECGILVLPSRSEAMGRILIESMAAGKPRIGANIDGIPTVINDNEDGLLFSPEDIKSLALKLRLLIEDESLRRRLGENGRNRAIKEMGKDTYFQNLFKFYEDVLSSTEKR